jgi:hypothetical protein
MTNTKFLVKVSRGTKAPEYLRRMGLPLETTPNRKLALAMGRFTAEDTVATFTNSRCRLELESVLVPA